MTNVPNVLTSRDSIPIKAKAESDDYLAMIDAYGNPACVLVSDLLDDLPMNSPLYFDPVGGDADIDILTVGVTGTPKLSWDESEDSFSFNKTLRNNDIRVVNSFATDGRIIYCGGSDPVANGAQLVAALAVAVASTPRGASRSDTNRASIYLMPGTYQVASALDIASSGIDIVGLGRTAVDVKITSNLSTATVKNRANAGLSLLTIENTGTGKAVDYLGQVTYWTANDCIFTDTLTGTRFIPSVPRPARRPGGPKMVATTTKRMFLSSSSFSTKIPTASTKQRSIRMSGLSTTK